MTLAELVYAAVAEFTDRPDIAEVECEHQWILPDGTEHRFAVTVRRQVRHLTLPPEPT